MSGSQADSARLRRGQYKKTKRRQEAILAAGLEVFAQRGFRAGSLREIAERVSMSEAGVLHHFPSKGQLLAAILDHRDDESRELVDLNNPDGRVVLRGLLEVARESSTRPGVVELYSVVSAEALVEDHPAYDYFVERYTLLRESIRGAFDRVHAEGGLKPGITPEQAAVATIALWDGLQIQWLRAPSLFAVEVELERYFDGLLTTPLNAGPELGVVPSHQAG